MPTFAERLRELREKAKLTQEQLADQSGVPVPSLRGYEQGQREPYWHVAYRLAAGLGVDCRAFADCVQSTTGKSQKARKAKSKRKGR
jgi:transcriptional regulator with XRE-family HTH domain